MRVRESLRNSVFSVCCLVVVGWSEVGGAADPPTVPWGGQERVEVELRTVPFYVVDATGQPINDLTAGEVVLEVDGVAQPFDVFDRFGDRPASPAPATPGSDVSSTPPSPTDEAASGDATEGRKVVLVVDLAFLSTGGLVRVQQVLASYLEMLPSGDQLYLLVNHPQKGLRQEIGPITASRSGREAVARLVAKLKTDPSAQFDPGRGIEVVQGAGRNGVPSSQLHVDLDSMRAGAVQRQFAMAETLADNYQQLAAFMTALAGSKLLVVLTPGLDRAVFFEGSDGLMAGSSGLYHVQTRHTPALVGAFEQPLAALEKSGALTVFVNPEQAENSGRDSLAHMRERTGGVLLEGTDPRELASRLAGGTALYYELGFYASQLPTGLGEGRLVVKIRREGARVYTPARLSSRHASLEMGRLGKRFWVVSLVQNGLERSEALRLAGQSFHDLPGRAAGMALASGRQLVFEPDWSALLGNQALEVFDVVLAVEPGSSAAEIHRFATSSLAAATERKQLTAPLPQRGSMIWGVVAVDPQSGATWMRRFLLEAPGSQAAVAQAGARPEEGKP